MELIVSTKGFVIVVQRPLYSMRTQLSFFHPSKVLGEKRVNLWRHEEVFVLDDVEVAAAPNDVYLVVNSISILKRF
jgi:hypothetical protein